MILVFGGTTEGRKAAEVLEEAGSPYFYSTKTGEQDLTLQHGRRIDGALDAEAMQAFCRARDIRLIVDAAHPFADLRALMRKVGTKQYFNNNKYKKQIKNNINNNYCSREKQCTTLENKCLEKNRNNNSKGLSDEGLSLTPTTSGLSSGKDEDMGAEDKGCQDPYFANRRSSNSSSGSWCFREEEIPENELLIQKNLEGNNTLLRTK